MRQTSTFDRLVSGLSGEERMDMLRSIEAAGAADAEPLYNDPEEDEDINLEIIHSRLGFIQRIILFFRALISQRDIMDVLEETMIQRYAVEIERAHNGLFDARTRALRIGFAREIKSLRDSLACFIDPLARALGPEKKDFVAFLAGFELPLHQEKILEVTDPDKYIKDNPAATDFDIRKLMDSELQLALKEISESDRAEMYRHLRSLTFLNELVFFPFSNILTPFNNVAEGENVPLTHVKNQILELGDILVSQGQPPSSIALKALLLFDPKMNSDQDFKKTEMELRRALDDAVQGLSKVRSFCSTLPVKKLLKVASGNLAYTPEQIGGGEDWFALYRRFWEDRMDEEMEEFSFRNSRRRLVKDACKLLRMDALPSLECYTEKELEEDLRVRFEITLSFFSYFVERLFLTDMNRALKIFLVDGDFYKSQNRQEFTDSYDGIRDTLDQIRRFQGEMSETGEIGHEMALVRGEMVKRNLRIKRLRDILKGADAAAEQIINDARGHLVLLISVMKGILFGESGGRYDTLSNISYIGGSENAAVLDRLNRSLKQAEEAQRIFNELYDLERSID